MIHTLANTLAPLVAQADEGDESKKLITTNPSEVSREFNQGIQHDLPWELLLVGLGATLIVIVVISLRRRWQASRQDPSPLMLYSAIARKAGLSIPDRFVLWRVAKRFKLPTPIALLLARGTLRHFTSLYLSNRTGPARQRLGDRFARIEAELFG